MTDSNLSRTAAIERKLALILEREMLSEQLIRLSLLAADAEQAVTDFDAAHPEAAAFALSN